jgi:heme exporter protein C
MTRRTAAVIAAAAGMTGAAALIFLYAPADALQGQVQRIFYLHVASAVAAYLCFAAVFAGGAVFLLRRSAPADRLARAAAEVGLVFTTVVLLMGSLWAKPIWGTFWTWDARLTSTLVLWMIYAGYLLVRRLSSPGPQAARLGAVVGIFGFIDVPVVHFSVTWWRTLHPQPVIETSNGLTPEMRLTVYATIVAVAFLASVLVAARYRLEILRERAAELEEAAELEQAPAPSPRRRVAVDT